VRGRRAVIVSSLCEHDRRIGAIRFYSALFGGNLGGKVFAKTGAHRRLLPTLVAIPADRVGAGLASDGILEMAPVESVELGA
jgi:hypothetical protein